MPKRVTVLRGERSRSYSADSIVVTVDAQGTVEAVCEAVTEHTRKAIQAGQKPSGGAQKPLGPDERKRAARGRRNRQRGMGQDGRFPRSIAYKARGGDLNADGAVAADEFFDEWQEDERSRGVEYLEADGEVDKVAEKALEADLKAKGWTE